MRRLSLLVLFFSTSLFAIPSLGAFPPAAPGMTKGSVVRTDSGTSLPATCSVGDTFLDTDADTDGSLYVCVSTNTWKENDDDGAAGGGNVSTSGVPALDDIAQFVDGTDIKGMTYSELWAIAGFETAAEGVLDIADLQGDLNAQYYTEGEVDTALAGKEATFSKNTGFNKDFGSITGTVCQGDDARLSDARTPTSHNNTYHSETYITLSGVTYENLSTNGDIGTGATQVSQGDHAHAAAYEPLDAAITKTDEAETLSANWVNETFPWADAEVANDISLDNISQITTKPITSLSATNWRLFYSAAGSVPVELVLGADGTFLKSNGAAVAPTWETPAGSGNVSTSGTPEVDDIAQFVNGTDIKGMTYAELWAIAGMESAAEGVLDIGDLQGSLAITALSATNWRLFYSADGSIPVELVLGADGTYLKSNGAAVAPTWETPAGEATTYEVLDSNGDVGAIAGTVCAGDDSRLSDARTPTSHNNTYHSETYITSAGVTYENLSANSDIGTGATQVSQGDHNHDAAYEAADTAITKTDEAETLTANWVNTDFPWANNEVADDITLTNITQITNRAVTNTTGNNWKVVYTNGSGAVTELALGGDETYLHSNGAAAAPTFETVGYAVTNTKSTTYTIGTDDARESYGGTIYVTAATTITAPAVAVGMNFTVVTIGAYAISVDVNINDRMYLDGTALSDGDKATNTSTTGDTITFIYESAAGWYAWSGSPDGDHWTDGN